MQDLRITKEAELHETDLKDSNQADNLLGEMFPIPIKFPTKDPLT